MNQFAESNDSMNFQHNLKMHVYYLRSISE